MKMRMVLIFGSLMLFAIAASAQKQKARINHTAIFVMDIKKTRAFYENIIGLDTIPEPFHDGKHIWFRTGPGSSLHVIAGSTEKKTYYKNQHTCYSVESVDQFVELAKKNKVQFEDISGKANVVTTRVDGVKQVWLQDPDGYWVEINDAKD
jgi:lactoylglutathione lyase